MYDLISYDLFGSIKTIIEKHYENIPVKELDIPSTPKIRMQLKRSISLHFNFDGQLMELTYFDKGGNISKKHVFSRFPDGRLNHHILHNAMELVTFTEYLYDGNESLIGYNEFNGNINGIDSSIEKGQLISTYLFVFDGSGNINGWEGYTTEGELNEIIEYTRNDKENVVAINHSRKGVFVHSDKSEYNDENMEVVRTILAENYSPKEIHRFDNLHNPVEITYVDADGIIERQRTFSYVFDEQNNWTKRTEFESGAHHREAHREIEYYDTV